MDALQMPKQNKLKLHIQTLSHNDFNVACIKQPNPRGYVVFCDDVSSFQLDLCKNRNIEVSYLNYTFD